MSGHVASQTSRQPDFHGASVAPSGLFPSDRESPIGSSLEGTCAADKLCLMMSFTAACLWCLPSLRLQLRACLPRTSTADPQSWQVWGPHTAVPKRRPTATLRVTSSILRPRAVTGSALSHAPDSLVDTESRRARSSSFSAFSSSLLAVKEARSPSHDFYLHAASPSGG